MSEAHGGKGEIGPRGEEKLRVRPGWGVVLLPKTAGHSLSQHNHVRVNPTRLLVRRRRKGESSYERKHFICYLKHQMMNARGDQLIGAGIDCSFGTLGVPNALCGGAPDEDG